MNVIVSNKFQPLLATLDIDLIKSINGEFTPSELASQFSNFFFNKMVLDITAIKDYMDITVIQELSVSIDMNKIVLLLDDSEIVNSPTYLSQLVSMGIYNFTRSIDAVKFLIDNPNSYKDVASYHNLNNTYIPTASTGDGAVNPVQPMGLRVIGFKNITEHAGATTLVYMLKKNLERMYQVKAVEVDKHDFTYLNDKSLECTTAADLPAYIAKNQNKEVILVDLNEEGSEGACSEVIYLIEPGLIKLNKLIRRDQAIFDKLKSKKIVLNRSILSNKDVADFEFESRSRVFFNIPYLDDKKDYQKVLDDFLAALGFSRLKDSGDNKSKLFNIFK
ncbi:MAG: hypothetical protein IJN03_00235 [Bacilli bacterium]|nr:hypothetical protein [Bacilli bacterium]